MFSRYLTIALTALTLLACAPEGYTIVRGAAEAGPQEEIILEETTERVYNCGEGGDVLHQTPSASILLSEAAQWEFGFDLGAGRDLALVALNGELEAKYGAEYKKSPQWGTGWELPARPGEWIEYTIRWSEVWQPGSVIVRRGDVEETVAYRYRKAIKSEIVGKRLAKVPTTDNRGRPKEVRWWRMRVVEDLGFAPNEEVDEVLWLRPADALKILTYAKDRELLSLIDPEQ